jgi:predicted anti-sigma-YlaC factor YlaD
MECDRAREAVSAQIDDEDGDVPDVALAAHLADCADCRAWEQRAHVLTRRARLGSTFLDHDLSARVLAAAAPAPVRRGRTVSQRAALAAVAALQLAVTVPLLILGHDRDAGVHAAHELGSFDLALAIAFCVGAIRPALSAGLAWPCGIASGALVGTAILDMAAGQTFGIDEAQHLIALAGALLLIWQARTISGPVAGPAAGSTHRAGRDARSASAAMPLPGLPPLMTTPRPASDGTDAARDDGPQVAAHATEAAAPAGDRGGDRGQRPQRAGAPARHATDPRKAVA